MYRSGETLQLWGPSLYLRIRYHAPWSMLFQQYVVTDHSRWTRKCQPSTSINELIDFDLYFDTICGIIKIDIMILHAISRCGGVTRVSRIDKLLEKMKNQPHNIRYQEIVKVLEYHGYQLVRTNGSHRHFRNSRGSLITVKEDKPTVKRAYVDDILQRIGE